VGEVESLKQSQQQQKPQFIQISQQRPIISDSRIFGVFLFIIFLQLFIKIKSFLKMVLI